MSLISMQKPYDQCAPVTKTLVNQICVTGLSLTGDQCDVRMCNSVAPSHLREHETKVKAVEQEGPSLSGLMDVFWAEEGSALRALTAFAEGQG